MSMVRQSSSLFFLFPLSMSSVLTDWNTINWWCFTRKFLFTILQFNLLFFSNKFREMHTWRRFFIFNKLSKFFYFIFLVSSRTGPWPSFILLNVSYVSDFALLWSLWLAHSLNSWDRLRMGDLISFSRLFTSRHINIFVLESFNSRFIFFTVTYINILMFFFLRIIYLTLSMTRFYSYSSFIISLCWSWIHCWWNVLLINCTSRLMSNKTQCLKVSFFLNFNINCCLTMLYLVLVINWKSIINCLSLLHRNHWVSYLLFNNKALVSFFIFNRYNFLTKSAFNFWWIWLFNNSNFLSLFFLLSDFLSFSESFGDRRW